MIDLFYTGGSLFMGSLSLIFLVVLVLSVLTLIQLMNQKEVSEFQFNSIKSVGLFAMVFGILGQLVGLFEGFATIEQIGEVSQAWLAGGLKVSSITTMYGVIIYLISYIIWFALGYWREKQVD